MTEPFGHNDVIAGRVDLDDRNIGPAVRSGRFLRITLI